MTMDDDEELTPVTGPLSGRGVKLRCPWCAREQRVDLGHAMSRRDSELYLGLITGGRSGLSPYQSDPQGTSSAIGITECCGVQMEGELYGWDDDPIETRCKGRGDGE